MYENSTEEERCSNKHGNSTGMGKIEPFGGINTSAATAADGTETEIQHVCAERCVICDQVCLTTSNSTAPNQTLMPHAVEVRQVIYEAFGIQVEPSSCNEFKEGLPLCPPCCFTVGGLRHTQKQLNDLKNTYNRLRSEMAMSIMNIVDKKNEMQHNDIGTGSKSRREILLSDFKKSEVDTLQQLVYKEFRYQAERTDDKFDFQIPIRNGEPKQYKNKKLHSSPKLDQNTTSTSSTITGLSSSSLPGPTDEELHNMNFTASRNIWDEKVKLIPDAVQKLCQKNQMDFSTSALNDDKNSFENEEKQVETKDEDAVTLDLSIEKNTVTNTDYGKNFEGTLPSDFEGETITLSMSPKLFRDGGYSSTECVNDEDSCDERTEFGQEATGTEAFEDDSFEEDVDVDEATLNKYSPNLEITEYNGTVNFLADDKHDQKGIDVVVKNDGNDEAASPAKSRRYNGIVDSFEIRPNKQGVYECLFCGKTFIHKYPYRDHLKTHTGEGPRCNICAKIFPKNHNLMLHMRTHTGEKPYVCTVCKKGFSDKSNLKVHMRVHTGERPYKCEYCDQGFVNSSRLIVHRRLHTGERPFPCDYCSRSFATSNQLSSHVKNHFNENKPYKCMVCGRGYTNATSLHTHVNGYHKRA